jgi:hypothetical protein
MTHLDGLSVWEWRDKWREADLERLRLRDAVRRVGMDPDALIDGEVERIKPDLRDPNIP